MSFNVREKNSKMQNPFISTYNTKIKLPTHSIGSLNVHTYVRL